MSEFTEKQLEGEAQRLYGKMRLLDYSMGECLSFAPLTLAINALKKEKNAVILAHNYQLPEILLGVADFTGDSFGLSVKAKETDAKMIVFCGVKFMAETAKILSPEKKVLVPSLAAGCSLADEINAQDIRKMREEHPDACVVCYVNTTAEVKAESDVCCTSANALKVIESVPNDEIIFVPDRFMAENLRKKTKKKIYSWGAKCVVHESFTPGQVREYKSSYPDLVVLAHLECRPEVIELADMAGSTNDMYNFVKESRAKRFMLVTECGMSDLLRTKFPEKEFINPCSICPYMKKITLQNTLESLEKEQFEISLEPETIERAKTALEKMLEIGK